MKKTKSLLIGFVITLLTVLIGYNVSISGPDQATRLKLKLKKPQKTEERMVAYNNWNYAMRNDGSYMYRASQTNFGGEFPRGTNTSCVYAAGMYLGALKSGSAGDPDTVNVSQVEFESECLPGKVLIAGAKDLKYRGYVDPNTGSDVTVTAGLGQLSGDNYQNDEYKVYVLDASSSTSATDYTVWPQYAPRLKTGAPMLLGGAAGQTYVVFNDLTDKAKPDGNDPLIHNPRFGLEMELESFSFTTGLLANGVFFKLSITNKASTNYRGAYLGLWADPDVGDDSGNDLARVDTVRGLGMVYSDPAGTDNAFTALGFDFLQGPVVDSSEVPSELIRRFYDDPSGAYRTILKYDNDNGILKIVNLGPTQFRLGATAFISYPNPAGEPSRLLGDVTRYWYIQGREGTAGLWKPNGVYDPTASGNLPGDQRIIHGVGPFVLRSGETQEIWFGIGGAKGSGINGPGVGFDHYNPQPGSAVAALQAVDDNMQIAFDNALASPEPPVSPNLTATALDGKVVLTWDNRSEYSYDRYGKLLSINAANFNNAWIDYDFQGYRVYRNYTGLNDDWRQVAQYDLIDGVTTFNDTLADSRNTIIYDISIGTDNGIQHSYTDTTVVNQRLYYYAVTAYDYQPLFIENVSGKPAGYPRSLESTITGANNMKLVIPMGAPAGIVYDGSVNNVLPKVSGTLANAYLQTRIIDPVRINANKIYKFEVFALKADTVDGRVLKGIVPGTLAFRVKDTVAGAYVKFDNMTDDPRTYYDKLPGNNTYSAFEGDSIFDDSYYSTVISYLTIQGLEQSLTASQILPRLNGVEIKLISDTVGVRDVYEVDNSGNLTSVFYEKSPTDKYKIVGFDGGTLGVLDSVNRYGTARNMLNPRGNYLNSDYEIRFITDPADSSVLFLGGTGGNIATGTFNRSRNRVPFQVWKMGWTSSTADDYRLELKMNGVFPHSVPTPIFTMINQIGSLSTYSERFQIIDSQYVGNVAQTNLAAISADKHVLGNFVIQNLDTITRFPAPGTKIRIVSFRPVYDGASFYYTQTGTSPKSKTLAKNALKDIKVVPNPYYGRVFEYQSSLFDKKVKFHHLPDVCTIRIFNVSGDLLRTIRHNNLSYNNRVDKDPLNRTKDNSTIEALYTSTEEWDLRNTKGAFVASGMYIALIEAPGIGKTTVKFAIIQEEMRIDGPDNR